MVPDRIEREILIDAPLEVVWAVVTEPAHVGSWFGDSAAIDLRPGGEAMLTWEKYGSFRARVEKVEPPHVFAFRWSRPADTEPRPGNSTLVEFSLSGEGETTRLRVVESGFTELDGSDDSARGEITLERFAALAPALRRLVLQRLADRAAGRPVPGAARFADQVAGLRRTGSAQLDLGSGVRAKVQQGFLSAGRD